MAPFWEVFLGKRFNLSVAHSLTLTVLRNVCSTVSQSIASKNVFGDIFQRYLYLVALCLGKCHLRSYIYVHAR